MKLNIQMFVQGTIASKLIDEKPFLFNGVHQHHQIPMLSTTQHFNLRAKLRSASSAQPRVLLHRHHLSVGQYSSVNSSKSNLRQVILTGEAIGCSFDLFVTELYWSLAEDRALCLQTEQRGGGVGGFLKVSETALLMLEVLSIVREEGFIIDSQAFRFLPQISRIY